MCEHVSSNLLTVSTFLLKSSLLHMLTHKSPWDVSDMSHFDPETASSVLLNLLCHNSCQGCFWLCWDLPFTSHMTKQMDFLCQCDVSVTIMMPSYVLLLFLHENSDETQSFVWQVLLCLSPSIPWHFFFFFTFIQLFHCVSTALATKKKKKNLSRMCHR